MTLSKNQKLHWRKTAKICPKCNQLRPNNQFIGDLNACTRCSFDELTQKDYAPCQYCRKWQKKEEFPKRRHKKDNEKQSSICKVCLQLTRERHAIYKGSPRLKKGKRYLCSGCGISKSCHSFPRGSNPETDLACKCCVTDRRIKEAGEFRCKGCASVFPVEQMHWNKYCERCFLKNKQWSKLKLRELRKDPEWAAYFKEMSRYKYYHVFKPIYNKTLVLQIANGLAKKRRINRNGYWYVLNHQIFQDFRKRFHYWTAITEKVAKAMKKGNAEHIIEELVRRPGQGMTKKERKELSLPDKDEWD